MEAQPCRTDGSISPRLFTVPMISFLSYIQVGQEVRMIDYGIFTGVLYLLGILFTIWGVRKYDYV